MRTVIDTRSLPPQERLAHLRQMVANMPEPVDLRSEHSETFRSVQWFAPLGGVVVGCVDTDGLVEWEVRRTPGLIRRSDPEAYMLLVNMDAQSGSSQHGRQAVLGPGDMSLYDTSRPMTGWRRAEGPARMGMIAIPRPLLPCDPKRVDTLLGERLAGPAGMGALLGNLVRQIVEDIDQYQPPEAARLSTVVADLLAAVVEHRLGMDRTVATDPSREVLLLRAQEFIEAHLADRRLTPAAVAAAHHVSLRTLHRAFGAQGLTVGAYIRDRRLEKCRRDLANPGLADRSADTIARSWGFPGGAYLSRLFQATYGMPPRDFRHLHFR